MRRKKIFDYSIITDNLIVGRTPYGNDYKLLKEMGVELVINMRVEWPAKLFSRQELIREIWAPSVDSKYYPLNKFKVFDVAKIANREIMNGGKVYVYCRKGRHRSIVMVATILMLQGNDKPAIEKNLFSKRAVADLRALDVASSIVKLCG